VTTTTTTTMMTMTTKIMKLHHRNHNTRPGFSCWVHEYAHKHPCRQKWSIYRLV